MTVFGFEITGSRPAASDARSRQGEALRGFPPVHFERVAAADHRPELSKVLLAGMAA